MGELRKFLNTLPLIACFFSDQGPLVSPCWILHFKTSLVPFTFFLPPRILILMNPLVFSPPFSSQAFLWTHSKAIFKSSAHFLGLLYYFHGFSWRPSLMLFSGHQHHFWDFLVIFVGFLKDPFYFLGYSLIIWTLSKIFIFIFAPFNHWAPLPILFFLELSPSLCLVSSLFARPFGSSKAHVILQLCGLGLPSPRPMSFISMGWISLVAHFRSQQQLMHLIIWYIRSSFYIIKNFNPNSDWCKLIWYYCKDNLICFLTVPY